MKEPINEEGQNRAAYQIARYIATHASDPLTLDFLGKQVGLSPHHLQRTFKAVIGLSPKVFQSIFREAILKNGIKGKTSITDAIYAAGYGSASRVYENLDKTLGMTPQAYRKGGDGEHISYAIVTTLLGPTLIAATDRGICFLQFEDDEATLLQNLILEFPQARIQQSKNQNNGAFKPWIHALNQFLESKVATLKLPLDIRGTTFQKLVWTYLQSIPKGVVQSYSAVAKAIGKPRAYRAVATACATNKIAIAIPCHRVVRGDGSLAGYRWGIDRKQVLIELERSESDPASDN